MLPLANIVPLSDTGWGVVLGTTVVACVLWVFAVVVVSRYRHVHGPGRGVQRHPPKEPGTASRLGARTVLVVAVGLSVLVLVVFLLARAADLLA